MSVRSAVGFDGGIPVGIQNLESVLATTPAGDGGNLDIFNLNSLTATTINGASAVGQDLGQTLTNGNTASKDINMNTFSLTNVSSINGFSTNRNTQGEFIANTTIGAIANTDFDIPIATTIILDIGTYLANIKINLSGTSSVPTSYVIYLYLDDGVTDDLLTSSFISSVSAINGVSLTIPAFPVAVTTDNSILTLRGKVDVGSSVVVSGFGDSYINCGLIFAGAITPPNPPVPTTKWIFTLQQSAPNGNWRSLASDSTGQYIIGGMYNVSAYRSVDYGATWNVSNAVDWPYTGVASSSSGVKLYASISDNIFIGLTGSENSGSTWYNEIETGVLYTNSVACSSDGVYVAVCSSGQIWTSNNGGLLYVLKFSGGSNFRSIASDSTGQYLVVVENGGHPYTSNDYGASWTQRSPSGSWVSVASDSTGTKLVACVNTGNIYTSTNSGATWTASTSAGIKNWTSVSSNSTGQYLFACVDNGFIYTSADGGVTWISQDSAGSRNWNVINTNSAGDRLTAVGSGYIYTGVFA